MVDQNVLLAVELLKKAKIKLEQEILTIPEKTSASTKKRELLRAIDAQIERFKKTSPSDLEKEA